MRYFAGNIRIMAYIWPTPLVLVLKDGLPPCDVLVLQCSVGRNVLLLFGHVQRGGFVQNVRLAVGVSPAELEDGEVGVLLLAKELLWIKKGNTRKMHSKNTKQ